MNDLNSPFLHRFEDRQVARAVRPSARGHVKGMGRLAYFWRCLSTRRSLPDLTDEQLKDVGLTRPQALKEAWKPFWRL